MTADLARARADGDVGGRTGGVDQRDGGRSAAGRDGDVVLARSLAGAHERCRHRRRAGGVGVDRVGVAGAVEDRSCRRRDRPAGDVNVTATLDSVLPEPSCTITSNAFGNSVSTVVDWPDPETGVRDAGCAKAGALIASKASIASAMTTTC